MASSVLGIHHVTAISGPAQENLDFYTGVLGLRLVKVTINYDDPSTHHLYYGDGAGSPGTLLTFFPYPDGYPGRPGRGQATVTSLAVPNGSLPAWGERFRAHEVDFDRITNRLGVHTIPFRAPDGLQLELAAGTLRAPVQRWSDSDFPAEMAIAGIRGATLAVGELEPTESVLVGLFGFRRTTQRDNRYRFEREGAEIGRFVDVLVDPQGPEGRRDTATFTMSHFGLPPTKPKWKFAKN